MKMPKPYTLAVLLAGAVSVVGVSAQSSLASLFDRYDVKPNFGQTTPGQPAWGGLTTWVTADGKGSVIVMVRAAPYFRVFTRDGQPVRTWGDAGLFNQAHSVVIGRRIMVGDRSERSRRPEVHARRQAAHDARQEGHARRRCLA